MFNAPGTRIAPEEFSRRLDEAKARAAVLRQEAMRDLGASLVAAVRRLAHAARGAGAAHATRSATHATR